MADDTADPQAQDQPEQGPAKSPNDENVSLDQAEIEALLNQAGGVPVSPSAVENASPPPGPAATAARDPTEEMPSQDVEFLLHQAQQALSSLDASSPETPSGASAFEWKPFAASPATMESASVDLMRDVQLDLTIELGRTHMHLEDVLRLKKGAVVTLDKLAGDPVDIYANGRLIARGEVLVLNDNFCVRVAELVEPETAPS